MQKCVLCGAEFEPLPNIFNQKYCSPKCRARAVYLKRKAKQPPFEKKICKYCGAEFMPNVAYRKFCSKSCMKRFHQEKQRKVYATQKRICFNCGKGFKPQSVGQKFCSKDCKMKYNPQKKESRLEQRIREAKECGLSYGYYVAKLSQGHTYEELKGGG